MLNITSERLREIKNNFAGKKIAVIGDLMLDGYYWGVVNRISPEAPVPVIDVDEEFFRFGGAANVALNLQSLGAVPLPVGVVGDDNQATIFNSLMQEAGISTSCIVVDESRPTTTKTRVIGGNQHIVRIDKENKNYISAEIEEKLLANIKNNISGLDAIIIEDNNNGSNNYELKFFFANSPASAKILSLSIVKHLKFSLFMITVTTTCLTIIY